MDTLQLISGEHTVEVDATYLPAGNYMYILEQNGYKITNKMSVVR
jgi:hypothetical protein